MDDVAKRAQVSRTTVSFVINNIKTAKISKETRQRVLDVVKEMAYRPNAAAQHVRTRRSNSIGLIADEIATAPYAGQIIKGAQDEGWRHNKILLVADTGAHPEMQQAAVEMMLQRQVESIIYATAAHREVTLPAEMLEVPTVLVNCFVQDRSLPSVVPDEVLGGRTATEALLRKQHRRIGVIMGDPDYMASHARVEGYKQALEAHGIAFDETLIRFGEWWQETGYVHARELMQLPERPTALFCGNDRIAIGAYDAFRELGFVVPDNVAVVGFDNQEIISAHSRPRLTTVELPLYQMGKWAVEYLTRSTPRRQARNPVQAVLECPLIERESI
jgi:LacI family transcriptional regulator